MGTSLHPPDKLRYKVLSLKCCANDSDDGSACWTRLKGRGGRSSEGLGWMGWMEGNTVLEIQPGRYSEMSRSGTNGQIFEIEPRRGHHQPKPNKPLGPTIARGLGGERKKNFIVPCETTQEGPREKKKKESTTTILANTTKKKVQAGKAEA